MFTFFECDTVCLLFLMQCVFVSIDVIKPATSKEGNSEVYVVGREYKDEPAFYPYLKKLLDTSKCIFFMYKCFNFCYRFRKISLKCPKLYENFRISAVK